ncbi:hypothetical protein HGA88_02455 [Candidatus Roizmanbacteria bacterium]|nr:hypothetical protein [Candidatus Roizmanbacteria bacterium]
MVSLDFSSNGGNGPNGTFSGYIKTQNAFFLLQNESEDGEEQTRQCLVLLKERFEQEEFESLDIFQRTIEHAFKTAGLSGDTISFCGVVFGETCYLLTKGKGEIYVKRGHNFARLTSGDTSASGYVEEKDIFVLTTQDFSANFTEDEIHSFIHANVHSIPEHIEKFTKQDPASFPLTLFVKVEHEEIVEREDVPVESIPEKQEVTEVLQKQPKARFTFFSTVPLWFKHIKLQQPQSKRRTFTIIFVVGIIGILIWSVVFGYQRRMDAETLKKLETSKELITQKITQAEDVSFLNPARSAALITEAQDELKTMKATAGSKEFAIVTEMEKLVQSKQDQVTNKENKQANEFFDLGVDSKTAQGSKMTVSEDTALILDEKQSLIYVLSLTKKSLDKRPAPSGTIQKMAWYNGDVFVLGTDGVMRIDKNSKSTKAVERDSDWGDVSDMAIFNGNLYLMDRGNEAIYKYVATDAGYAAKSSYFKGTVLPMKNATSFAIDSSIYVSTPEKVVKYTSGLSEDFKTTYPSDSVSIEKVITGKDTEQVYAWDKQNSVVYVLEKNGTYVRQVTSKIFGKATDVVAYKTNTYALSGGKIYEVSME